MTQWWCNWPGPDEDSLWGTMQWPLAKYQSLFLEVTLSGSPPHGESMLPGMCVHGLHEELRFCTSWWCQCVLLLLFGWSDPCSIIHWPPMGLFQLLLPGKAPWFSPHLSVQLLGAQQIDRDVEWEEEPANWMLLNPFEFFRDGEWVDNILFKLAFWSTNKLCGEMTTHTSLACPRLSGEEMADLGLGTRNKFFSMFSWYFMLGQSHGVVCPEHQRTLVQQYSWILQDCCQKLPRKSGNDVFHFAIGEGRGRVYK